jgi:hypothetical protein
MPADAHAAEAEVLRRRYPRWTIWFGEFTGHWWALPPQERDIGDFVEAETTVDLIARIEAIRPAVIPEVPRRDRRRSSRSSRPLAPEGAAPPRSRQVPVAAWPGGTAW